MQKKGGSCQFITNYISVQVFEYQVKIYVQK